MHSIIRTIVISFAMRTLVIEWFTVIGGSNQYHQIVTSSYHQHGLFISLPLLYDFILSSDNFLCYHLIIVSLLVVIFVNSYQYVSYHFYLFIVSDCECIASWQIFPYFCIVSYHLISYHLLSINIIAYLVSHTMCHIPIKYDIKSYPVISYSYHFISHHILWYEISLRKL